MSSPIRAVFKNLHNALVGVAPEMAARFDREFDAFILEYLDSDKFICRVDTKTRHLEISRCVLELLWTTAYAHFCFYHTFLQGKQVSAPAEINPRSNTLVSASIDLMVWRLWSWIGKTQPSPWPSHLPHPTDSHPTGDLFLDLATEVASGAAAYMLLHELAHILRRHPRGVKSLAQEREADHEATDWVLAGVADSGDLRFLKRLLCVLTAVEVNALWGIHTGDHDGITHPRDFDRLIHAIDRFAPKNHGIWAMVYGTLSLHMLEAGIPIEKNSFPEFYDATQHLINALADRERRMSEELLSRQN